MLQFVKKHQILIAILVLGFFLRIYNLTDLLTYSHDQDLAGWFVRDVLENKHLRLIGQETSTAGIFIGPLFYYLLVPFYLFFGMDPIGGAYLTAILGVFTIWSVYYVFKNIAGNETGIIGAFIFSISYYTLFNDHEVVPTMPVLLWSVWYLMAIHLLYKGGQKWGLILLGILVGLIWHLNFALVIVLPLAIVSILGSRKKLQIKYLLASVVCSFIISLPLIAFEIRHGFIQSKAFMAALTTDQNDVISGFEKVQRVYHLISKNFTSVIYGDYFDITYEYMTYAFLIVLIVLLVRQKINKLFWLILVLWFLIYWAFFSFYSKSVSEYYLNGSIVVFVFVISFALSILFKNKKTKDIGMAILVLFTVINLDRFITHKSNNNGYKERKAIISQIKKDSVDRGFDCVSISYITDLGYDRGYRYFMWQEDLKTKEISEKVPVYTIVFPLKDIFPTNKTEGGVGLINPDYSRYLLEVVKEACRGDNFNQVNPMIGFTD